MTQMTQMTQGSMCCARASAAARPSSRRSSATVARRVSEACLRIAIVCGRPLTPDLFPGGEGAIGRHVGFPDRRWIVPHVEFADVLSDFSPVGRRKSIRPFHHDAVGLESIDHGRVPDLVAAPSADRAIMNGLPNLGEAGGANDAAGAGEIETGRVPLKLEVFDHAVALCSRSRTHSS